MTESAQPEMGRSILMRDNPATKVVLLVEDNDYDEELTVRSLKKSGISNQIVVCRDGQEALDWLFIQGSHASRDPKLEPQVVLLDLKLPKLSGLEVLKAIRLNPATQVIPVVIMTSSKEESDIAKGYELRANSYIQKRINSTELAEIPGLYWLKINEVPSR